MSDDKGRGELTAIEQTMRDRPAEYFRDAGMQDRYRSLVDARDAGGAVAPAKSGARAARMREIEGLMKTDRSSYFKDEALQAEYRALVEGGDGETPPVQRQPVADRSAATPAALGVALEPDQLARARQRVDAVVGALDPAISAQLEASFLGLSDATRAAVVTELARPSASIVKPLNPDEVAAAKTKPEFASLAALWGPSAPAQLGRVVDAFNRIVAALGAKERGEFLATWRGATARERQLLAWSVAGVG